MRSRGQRGVLRLALAWALLLLSLSWVVWRQSRVLDELRALDELRRQHAVLEARRAELLRRLETLESRGEVVDAARTELDMRIPTSTEIVILQVPDDGFAVARNEDRGGSDADPLEKGG